MTEALAVENLSVARGGAVVLAGVSLSLAAGEVLQLRGPNGIGKTTLLRCIAGLQPPEEGRISADPETIAYAGHADGIKPTLTVAENLRFWARVFGRAEIGDALDGMNLAMLADRPAANLSAGQKRRLGLARLLVTGRRLWLLDEPTVSLDAASVALFAAAVRAHLAAGGAALAATHSDLGLGPLPALDLTPFRPAGAGRAGRGRFDEAFG
ncbi:MAG: heme ABC exporter ATP-binding protein CcmA [Pseudomonadota bacterium]